MDSGCRANVAFDGTVPLSSDELIDLDGLGAAFEASVALEFTPNELPGRTDGAVSRLSSDEASELAGFGAALAASVAAGVGTNGLPGLTAGAVIFSSSRAKDSSSAPSLLSGGSFFSNMVFPIALRCDLAP